MRAAKNRWGTVRVRIAWDGWNYGQVRKNKLKNRLTKVKSKISNIINKGG